MKLTEQIHDYVDSQESRLDENFFKAISAFLSDHGVGNEEQKKVKFIQKNLTKQIWSRYFLFKKRRKQQLKAKGFNVLILDRKFFDDFMKSMSVDAEIKRDVYKQVGQNVKKLDELYKPYKKKDIGDDEMIELLRKNEQKLSVIAGEVINAIALNSTIKYLDEYLDTDMSELPDGVLRSGLKGMRSGTSKFAGHMMSAITNRMGK